MITQLVLDWFELENFFRTSWTYRKKVFIDFLVRGNMTKLGQFFEFLYIFFENALAYSCRQTALLLFQAVLIFIKALLKVF